MRLLNKVRMKKPTRAPRRAFQIFTVVEMIPASQLSLKTDSILLLFSAGVH